MMIHESYRDVDGAVWEDLAAKTVAAMAEQYQEARAEHAFTIECGARVAYAATIEDMLK